MRFWNVISISLSVAAPTAIGVALFFLLGGWAFIGIGILGSMAAIITIIVYFIRPESVW